jgi:hypothetical protein
VRACHDLEQLCKGIQLGRNRAADLDACPPVFHGFLEEGEIVMASGELGNKTVQFSSNMLIPLVVGGPAPK